MIDITFISQLIALGAIVGFMAGLLGIGGGGIMVPVLTTLFIWNGVNLESVVHLALGTSMASIVTTSFSSMRAHNKRGGVHWHAVVRMTPGIMIGTFLATFLAAKLSPIILAGFFSIFMLCVAIQMFVGATPHPSRSLPGNIGLVGAGAGIGGISALVSIGGGTMSVPFLYWHNIQMKQAIGTSAALGVPIAVSGTFGYIVNGWQQNSIEEYTFGFIYLPAVLIISMLSAIFAPLGVKFAYKLPVKTIKKVFALLLLGLATKMFLSVMS